MTGPVRKVLDHGFVHLVDSLPAKPENDPFRGRLGVGDRAVVQAARVSTGHLPLSVHEALGLTFEGEERSEEKDIKLIEFMMKNGHTSPFEQVRFKYCVKLPIFCARQLIRHRMGSFNEQSARYSVLPCEYYVPELWRMQGQHPTNKQMSGASLEDIEAERCAAIIGETSQLAYSAYESMLNRGLSRELARMVLPTNFYTQWYWTVDLHNLMGLLSKRLMPDAQYETRVYAEAFHDMAQEIAPVSMELFHKYRLGK